MKKTILVTNDADIIEFSIIQYFYQKNYKVLLIYYLSLESTNQIAGSNIANDSIWTSQ
jgi:hypothetical protein